MIEICVDICHHLISAKKYRIPTSYSDTFLVLFEAQILDESLMCRVQQMARFRNILVHNYEKVDPAIVIPLLKNNLNDFTLFRNAILEIFYASHERIERERTNVQRAERTFRVVQQLQQIL